MTRYSTLLAVTVLAMTAAAVADEPQAPATPQAQTIKATYLITGLHCPPCTRTVEASLQRVKGVRAANVDWRTKNARVEFDEANLPAQKVAQLIAGTPHMMGGGMRYAGWLVLRVPDVNDEATAKPTKEVLKKLTGVKQVAAYPAQHSVAVSFGAEGSLTSRQLTDALKEAGISAEIN